MEKVFRNPRATKYSNLVDKGIAYNQDVASGKYKR